MPPSGISSPALGFTNELRRARLGVEGTIPGGFEYKLEADFASGDVEVTDALLAYEHGQLKLTVGQHNNFQGLEEMSSSNDISFIERSAEGGPLRERKSVVEGKRGSVLVDIVGSRVHQKKQTTEQNRTN